MRLPLKHNIVYTIKFSQSVNYSKKLHGKTNSRQDPAIGETIPDERPALRVLLNNLARYRGGFIDEAECDTNRYVWVGVDEQ